ncbi:MFS transporter [Kitasatospora sp. NPDC089913]|uniref:MFS transporter n=1 Tax=Kitasatospora sp. NPDC089913 TaxID=3364080 RepID=UPI0038186B51
MPADAAGATAGGTAAAADPAAPPGAGSAAAGAGSAAAGAGSAAAGAALLAQWTLACCAVWALLTVLPLHLTQRHHGAGTVAALVTEAVVSLRLMRILAGPALGRLRPRTAITAALGLGALAFGALAATGGSAVVLAAVLPVLGLGFGMNAMALKLIAAAAPDRRRARGFASQAVAVNLGMALGPLGGVALQQRFGTAAFCAAAACVHVVALGLVMLAGPPGEAAGAAVGAGRTRWKALLREPGPRMPLALTALGFVLYTQLFATLPLYAKEVLGAGGSLGTVFLVNGVLIIALQLPVTLLSGRLGVRPTTLCAVGFGCFAAAFACLGAGRTVAWLFAGVVLVTFAEMLLMPALDVLVGSAGPARHRAAHFSLAALATGLGEAVGSFSGVRVATADGLGTARLYTALAVLTAALLLGTTAVRLLRTARTAAAAAAAAGHDPGVPGDG